MTGDSIKRVFDVAVVVLTAVVWVPLLLALAVVTRAVMGRPVFFRQERAGLDGRTFRLVKLRTMREGVGPDAERLTRLGRWLRATSLDELPELWHVLTGEMSLVGPRPLPVRYLARYSQEQARRHEARPGITGWAQVNGRNTLTWERKFEHDVWYVGHRCFWLDLTILCRTVWLVLARRGIQAEGEATMGEFEGYCDHAPGAALAGQSPAKLAPGLSGRNDESKSLGGTDDRLMPGLGSGRNDEGKSLGGTDDRRMPGLGSGRNEEGKSLGMTDAGLEAGREGALTRPGRSGRNDESKSLGAAWAGLEAGRAVVIACLAGLAWRNRFVQDDAFISFRYARNLAEGHGLVWNLGERVEGYTNFLWTVCLAPAFWLGVDVVLYSYTLSLAAFCCTLWLTWVIADDLWRDRRAGLAAAVLLGTNHAFSNYGTGGLETQFMTAWTLGALAALSKWRGTWGTGWMLMAAAASVGALMTRLDAALLLGPAWVWAAARLWRRAAWREFFYVALIVLPPLASWFLWRHAYYGRWLPNTALIKVGAGGPTWLRGLFYAGLFYLLYGFALAAPVCFSGLARVLRKPWIICAGVTLIVWHGYIVWVGGDFMEFRMLMPALPLVMICLVGGLLQSAAWARGVAILCLMACSLAQGVWRWNYPCTEPKHQLQANAEKWRGVAETLNGVFGEDRHALKIGVTAAGVVPFCTGMPALDLLGLNDRDVALHGDRIEPLVPRLGNRPGHVKMATQQQVRGKGVHLLLNNPWVVSAAELAVLSAERVMRRWNVAEGGDERRLSWERVDWTEDGGFTRVVAWPCQDDNYLLSLYVRADERIDRAIKRCQATVLR